MLEGTTNPSAPKVPRRDNLAASDTNGQICQDWYNFSWGGPCSPGRAAHVRNQDSDRLLCGGALVQQGAGHNEGLGLEKWGR